MKSVTPTIMVGTLVGYARRSTGEQDLTELFSVSRPTGHRTLRRNSRLVDTP